MTIVAHAQTVAPIPHKIYATRKTSSEMTEADRQAIRKNILTLSEKGSITDRDERLLEYLRDLSVLSLGQVRRLLFVNANERTTYQRLYLLAKNKLIDSARIPRTGMIRWGLPTGKVYTLGYGGRVWLQEEVGNDRSSFRHLRSEQVLHDLLVAELCVRLIEATCQRGELWSLTWFNDRAASLYSGGNDNNVPVTSPDGLAIVRQKRGNGKAASLPFFIELDASREAHGRPSSDWGRKVLGYDRYRGTGDESWKTHAALASLPTFPIVAVITHGEHRLINLANAINEHRQQKVIYYLALWEDLMAGEDFLSTPAWMVVSPDGHIVGEDPVDRQSLLPTN